jgi:molybdopterin/thiamine biosynthesis adenylyltransferase
MEPWFLKYPQRLQKELQALQDAGYSYSLDEDERKAGRIIIKVKYIIDDGIHELMAVFPESYPYFPFEITSSSFPGGRHKDPYTGSLCLLKDPHTKWRVDDRLASILNEQMPKLVRAHQHPENATDLEAHEATQVTGQLQYQAGMVIYTGEWNIDQKYSRGHIVIGVEENVDPNKVLRGAILEVRDEKNCSLESLDVAMSVRYQKKFAGRWVRLPSAPTSTDANVILQQASSIWPDLKTPKFKHGPDVIGILVREEVQYGQYHENWIFIVRTKAHISRGVTSYPTHLVRSDQASIKVLSARSPKLFPLSKKKILVVGLGSIGSVFAWQMARAGVGQINLLDFDHLQLGNLPRWMYGSSCVGHSKSQVLSAVLQQEYPFMKAQFFQHRIGGIKYTPLPLTDLDVLPEALDGVDMIVDATAEWCVSHFLSDVAREKGIDYIWATGTPGSWGGAIGRVVPGQTGCWKCYQRQLTERTITPPNQEGSPDVQPPGCFHPTFTGTGFDMDHVTIEAVRLAVSTLCLGHESAYPNFNWDVGIVNLFSKDGMPIVPSWQTYKLVKHPECDCHE